MKTFIFSALALGMMASCANTDVEGVVDNGEPVAIRLSAGVQQNVVVSRAPITGAGAKFKPTILGWEAETTADYTGTPWNASTTEDIAGNASDVSITLNPVQYYNANEAINTFMKAFYVSDNATVTVDNDKKYIYTFENTDGSKDVLLSNVVSGNKTTTDILNFSFTHPLTQVSFKVVAGTGLVDGTTLTSITLKNAALPTGFDFSKEDPLTYEAAKDLAVSNITSTGIGSTAVTAGNPVMIQPISDLKLDIVTSTGTFKDVPVVLTDKTTALLAGTSYTITLTFSQKAITGTASVADWTSGEGGADVQ